MLDGGSTSGNGSFLSHSSGHAWLAPWRFSFGARRLGVQSLPHWWVLADEIALFSLRSSSQFGTQDAGPSLPRRESHHPARAPKPTPAPVNPTFRQPRVILPKRGGAPPASSAPSPATSTPQLDRTAIVTLLRSLGLSEDLLTQVRAALPPPQSQKREQRLLQLRGQIDSAKAHAERLERVCYSSSFAAANVYCEPRPEIG